MRRQLNSKNDINIVMNCDKCKRQLFVFVAASEPNTRYHLTVRFFACAFWATFFLFCVLLSTVMPSQQRTQNLFIDFKNVFSSRYQIQIILNSSNLGAAAQRAQTNFIEFFECENLWQVHILYGIEINFGQATHMCAHARRVLHECHTISNK